MNEELCAIIERNLIDKVVGEVRVEAGTRYNKAKEMYVPVYIVNITSPDFNWHKWYEVDYIFDYFNSGKTIDDLIGQILWKYKGFLIYKCVTEKYFKLTA